MIVIRGVQPSSLHSCSQFVRTPLKQLGFKTRNQYFPYLLYSNSESSVRPRWDIQSIARMLHEASCRRLRDVGDGFLTPKPDWNESWIDAKCIVNHLFSSDNLASTLNDCLTKLSLENERKLVQLINRRMSGEPIAYLLGTREFYGLSFHVNEHTLIPRPDTELLVDACLSRLSSCDRSLVVDVGTGSGCILLSVLQNSGKNVVGIGIDVSPQALKMAEKNRDCLGIPEQAAQFVEANILQDSKRSISDKIYGLYYSTVGRSLNPNDCPVFVVSNPPYLQTSVVSKCLSTEFEPSSALDGGNDGLEFYQPVSELARSLGSRWLGVEFGYDQGGAVERLLLTDQGPHRWEVEERCLDLQGHFRALVFKNEQELEIQEEEKTLLREKPTATFSHLPKWIKEKP